VPSSVSAQRGAAGVVALTVALACLIAPAAARASVTTADQGEPAVSAPAEHALTAALAAERSARHLPALATARDLTDVARAWATRMADAHEVAQNPDLRDEAGDWIALGENVGMGPDAASVDRAFLTSSSHRANIYDRHFTEVGIGAVVTPDGTLFVVEDFREPAPVATPSATSPPPARRQAPRAVPVPRATPSPQRPAPASLASGPTRKPDHVVTDGLGARLTALTAHPVAALDPLAGAARFVRSIGALAGSRGAVTGADAGRRH